MLEDTYESRDYRGTHAGFLEGKVRGRWKPQRAMRWKSRERKQVRYRQRIGMGSPVARDPGRKGHILNSLYRWSSWGPW